MILREERARLQDWRVEILGTDLSTELLEKAQAGLYTQFEVQRGLPIDLLVKYFKQDGEHWQIDELIRRMITFRPFNLLDDLAAIGQCDVVFCRNVLIYFDLPTKSAILDRVARIMPPDGFLYLGGAETILGVSDRFRIMPGLHGVYGLSEPQGGDLARAVG